MEKFGLENCKLVNANEKIISPETLHMYLAVYTKIGTAYTVSVLNHFNQNIVMYHWKAFKRAPLFETADFLQVF